MNIKQMDNKDGFTLIEILIALVVLTFGILAVVGLFNNSIKGNAMGRKVTEATTLAQSRLDELMTAAVYENLLTNYPGTQTGLTATGEAGGIYTLTTAVDNVHDTSNNPVSGIYLITVTVTWEGTDRTHTVTLQSLRAEGT